MAAVFNIFWTIISQLASYVLSSKWWQMAIVNTHVCDAKDYKKKKKKKKKKTWIVTVRCSFGDHLKFQNG